MCTPTPTLTARIACLSYKYTWPNTAAWHPNTCKSTITHYFGTYHSLPLEEALTVSHTKTLSSSPTLSLSLSLSLIHNLSFTFIQDIFFSLSSSRIQAVWQDGKFIFSLYSFSQLKLAQKQTKFAKVLSKLCQILNKPSIIVKLF